MTGVSFTLVEWYRIKFYKQKKKAGARCSGSSLL